MNPEVVYYQTEVGWFTECRTCGKLCELYKTERLAEKAADVHDKKCKGE